MTVGIEETAAARAVDATFAQGGLNKARQTRRGAGGNRSGRVQPSNRARAQRTGRDSGSSSELVPEVVHSGAVRPGVVKISGWGRFPWLRAGFSTRQGGASTVYSEAETREPGEQNLGWTADDGAEIVAGNRRRFLSAVAGGNKMELVTVRQFHSGMVRVVEPGGARATQEGKAVLRGDGLMSQEAGVLLGVQTADCVPVLIADTQTRAVAAFHAGWRGTLARIVERGVGAMRLQFGSDPKNLIATIGPAIGPCCFAVGEEVRFEFESQFSYSFDLFSEVYDSNPVRQRYPMLFLTARAPGHSNLGPQIHLDLWEANRRQLLDAGLGEKAISIVGECTACTRLRNGRRKYFSHRAEHGFTGRMLSVIGVTGTKVRS